METCESWIWQPVARRSWGDQLSVIARKLLIRFVIHEFIYLFIRFENRRETKQPSQVCCQVILRDGLLELPSRVWYYGVTKLTLTRRRGFWVSSWGGTCVYTCVYMWDPDSRAVRQAGNLGSKQLVENQYGVIWDVAYAWVNTDHDLSTRVRNTDRDL